MEAAYERIIKDANNLKEEFPKLTDFEALQIAAKIHHIEAIENAFGVSGSDPAFFEAIAMILGYSGRGVERGGAIVDAIKMLAK